MQRPERRTGIDRLSVGLAGLLLLSASLYLLLLAHDVASASALPPAGAGPVAVLQTMAGSTTVEPAQPVSPTISPPVEPTQPVSPTISPPVEPTQTVSPITPSPTPALPITPTLTPTTESATPSPAPTGAKTRPPMQVLAPMPTPTAPPPQPTDLPQPDDPHVDYAATTAVCAGCHRTHTASGIALRHAWPEESLCFGCHASAGPGTNVEPAFANYLNSGTAFFKHDVYASSGVHRAGEMEGPDFGGSMRHVECEDCHEPHEATRGPASPPFLQREMTGASGADPVWSAEGAPAGYVWLPDAGREYQVCFKCHSSFTTLPTYLPDGWDGTVYVADGLRKLTSASPLQIPDSRDMAQEFNPYQASYHPVAAQGQNPDIAPGAFVPGWSADSLVYCSDCHRSPYPGTEGDGPHGSPLLHLLTGVADYQTAAPDVPLYTGGELCFDCHDEQDYTGNGGDSNFHRGNRNLHGQHSNNATCYLCHDSHGSEQLHLLNLDLSILDGTSTYLLAGYDGLPTDSQTVWQISPDGSEKTCWIVCHSHDHSRSSYPNLHD